MNIEYVIYKEKTISIIIRNNYKKSGTSFITPNNFSQQLAFMNHEKGKVIEPHVHNPVPRKVIFTQEVLFIKKGKLRVDFYDENQIYIESKILSDGDVIMLVSGGHGFEILEDIEMIEVKQGPYSGDKDKTKFFGIASSKVIFKQSQK